jgi:hypothetical protein
LRLIGQLVFTFPLMRTNRSLAGRANLSIGGLTFGLGDADTLMFGTLEAAIQYNNGAFNGFFYISDFMFQGNPYELSLEGGTLAIYPIVNGFPGFNSLVNGTLNIGNGNLSDVSVFTPPVPEPATGGLRSWVAIHRRQGFANSV